MDSPDAFLAQFEGGGGGIVTTSKKQVTEDGIVRNNKYIINFADELLLERLENKDSSLRTNDIVSIKAEAFKQNRLIEGKNDEGIALIPSVINIQVINN